MRCRLYIFRNVASILHRNDNFRDPREIAEIHAEIAEIHAEDTTAAMIHADIVEIHSPCCMLISYCVSSAYFSSSARSCKDPLDRLSRQIKEMMLSQRIKRWKFIWKFPAHADCHSMLLVVLETAPTKTLRHDEVEANWIWNLENWHLSHNHPLKK